MENNIAFVTCVELGFECLKELYISNLQVNLLFTLEDKEAKNKSGRVYLDEYAAEKNIQLEKIKDINEQKVIDLLSKNKIDYLFIIGWSQIVSQNILKIPKKGCFGIHPTLLPKGRGRASIPWAILKELPETGATLFKIDEGVDSGPIIFQEKIKLNRFMNASELYIKMCKAHKSLIKKFSINLKEDTIKEYDQDHKESTYWPGRKPIDGEINFEGSIYEAEKLIRATTKPYPGAFFLDKTTKIIVWESHISKSKKNAKKFIIFNDGTLVLDKYEEINL